MIDVLGLASFLKEHRDCKVVLILNDEELGKDKDAFEQYSEKVIDTSLVFAPTAAEAAEIALDKKPSYQKHLAECTTRLGVANIRVLRKIERLVGLVEPLVKGCHPHVMKQAISTLVLFGWAVYEKHDGLLKFAVSNRNNNMYQLGNTKHTDEENEWDGQLGAYGFGHCDAFDNEILKGIRAGFFDVPELVRIARELDATFKEGTQKETIDKPWTLYRDSFDDNVTEFAASIENVFKNHIGGVTWSYLDSAVRMMKHVGKSAEAQSLLAAFMKHNKHEQKDFYEPDLISDIKDADVRSAMEERARSFVDTRDGATVLYEMVKRSGWSQEDITLLAKLTPEDFYQMFKRLRGIELRSVGRRALDFHKESKKAGDAEYKTIGENAIVAFKRLAKESPFNAQRVINLYSIPVE